MNLLPPCPADSLDTLPLELYRARSGSCPSLNRMDRRHYREAKRSLHVTHTCSMITRFHFRAKPVIATLDEALPWCVMCGVSARRLAAAWQRHVTAERTPMVVGIENIRRAHDLLRACVVDSTSIVLHALCSYPFRYIQREHRPPDVVAVVPERLARSLFDMAHAGTATNAQGRSLSFGPAVPAAIRQPAKLEAFLDLAVVLWDPDSDGLLHQLFRAAEAALALVV